MRITFLTHFPGRGGSTSMLMQLLRYLQDAGHQTEVIVGSDSDYPQIEQYKVFRPSHGANWRQRLLEYRRLVDGSRPDLVYTISGVEEADILRFLEVPRIRHTFTVEQHEFLDSPYLIQQNGRFWEACSANTPDIFEFLRPYGPFDFKELDLPYKIDADFQQISPESGEIEPPIQICLITRLENFQKRAHWLPEIVAGCQKASTPLHWHIYGAGPSEDCVRKGLESRGCAKLVTFHGWLSGPELAKRAVQHHLFFNCSRFEGLPVSMVEALFCGLACIVPDLPGGLRYIIEKGGCYPYKPTSPAACVEVVTNVASELKSMRHKRTEARMVAENLFGAKTALQKYALLEAELVKLKFNGRIERIETARKIRRVKPMAFFQRMVLRARGIKHA